MNGLSSAEIPALHRKFGKNIIESVGGETIWRKILHQFTDLMVIILMVSALIAVVMGYYENNTDHLIDGYVILGVVLLNAAIGFFQEYKTEKALEALKKLVAPRAIVIRNGKKIEIQAKNIVPGDLVVLAAGDKIPADGELKVSDEFKAEESALTGESLPVHKKIKQQVFMGTTCVAGSGLMRVSHTGMRTTFGKIAHLTTTTVKDLSPLQKEMNHVGLFVTKVTLSMSTILVLMGTLFQGKEFMEALLFAVSVAVAAVPEGLPVTLTVALALGVQKMVKKKALVKQLSSIETLGSTTVICSDKTGTLTRNEMTVTRLLLGTDELMDISGLGYDPQTGQINPAGENCVKQPKNLDNLSKIRLISGYCTEAQLKKEGSRYSILGDPTEGALLTLAQKPLKKHEKIKIPTLKTLKKLPFDSVRKMMSVVIEEKKGAELWTKGSPDEIIKRSTHLLIDGKQTKLTASDKKTILRHYELMAAQALRVIAFAYKPLSEGAKKKSSEQLHGEERKLVFLGLTGMIDPPRKEVPEAVKTCHNAGIRTIIITGDHGLTAKAIAKQIGIANDDTPIILGDKLEQMTERELDQLLKSSPGAEDLRASSLIFSRVTPEHKRRIVDRLKKMNEVVAVTGDGVNDAPALKRADLGIAMGITGTEVTKETANMILLDDSFATIVQAVHEGRNIYNNMKKFIWFIFSCNIGEILVVFSSILLQVPTPLTATLILAVNLGTDILPGIALGMDHSEPGIMDKRPRDHRQRILQRGFIIHVLAIGISVGVIVLAIFFWKISSLGWSYSDPGNISGIAHSQGMTIAFTSLVIIQLFNAFNARSFSNSIWRLKTHWQLWAAVAASVVMVMLFVYLPWFNRLFRTTPLNEIDWLVIFAGGSLLLGGEELRKYLSGRTKQPA